jgi:hypothetical protein
MDGVQQVTTFACAVIDQSTAKAQVLTQRRKAAKMFKKTFDFLCVLASWRLNLMFLESLIDMEVT